MNDIEKSRVSEICRLHNEIGGYLKMTLDRAIRIGQLLTEQKAGLTHGKWLPWVEANCPFSERLARDYMRFYDRRDELKTASVADLSEARKYLVAPKEETSETEILQTVWPLLAESVACYYSLLDGGAIPKPKDKDLESMMVTMASVQMKYHETHPGKLLPMMRGKPSDNLSQEEELESVIRMHAWVSLYFYWATQFYLAAENKTPSPEMQQNMLEMFEEIRKSEYADWLT
ncbi:MAG: DUF3102 domain-containing protein [Spirochaetales bacterium]|nr:DUF3102 domain-containing protein [Spirochaetales bacterium]